MGVHDRYTWIRHRWAGIVEPVSDIGSTPEGSDGEYSLDDDDQLQPEDTLVDRGVDDVLDEGYSPPDHQPSGARHGLTEREQRDGETLDERLAEEEADIGATDPLDDIEAEENVEKRWRSHESDRSDDFEGDEQAGDGRSGRLVAPDEGAGVDREKDAVAGDVGIDGAGASAEEAAMHYIAADEVEWSDESDSTAGGSGRSDS
jgi:hypothetical protein